MSLNWTSDSIREIKANASKWSNELTDQKTRFEWQKGYGAFSVSYSQIESVRHYIQNQHEHHQTKTYEEEYIKFLELHDIPFEHRYYLRRNIVVDSLSPLSRLWLYCLIHRLTPVATCYCRIRGFSFKVGSTQTNPDGLRQYTKGSIDV